MLTLRDKVLLRLPPSSNWRQERQPDPPCFGWARLIDDTTLHKAIAVRQKALKTLSLPPKFDKLNTNEVSLIVLSCRRMPLLLRLVESLQEHFSRFPVPVNIKMRNVLVDNDSGDTLITAVQKTDFFDEIVLHPRNLGMSEALRLAYANISSEYVIFVEDDFIISSNGDFVAPAVDLFTEFPEIGIIRLKNQNNWWKPYRQISASRRTGSGHSFRTWLPARENRLNGWCAGSVMFRNEAYRAAGGLPVVEQNNTRRRGSVHQGHVYELDFGQKFNDLYLAAKFDFIQPFLQPNDNEESAGWDEK